MGRRHNTKFYGAIAPSVKAHPTPVREFTEWEHRMKGTSGKAWPFSYEEDGGLTTGEKKSRALFDPATEQTE